VDWVLRALCPFGVDVWKKTIIAGDWYLALNGHIVPSPAGSRPTSPVPNTSECPLNSSVSASDEVVAEVTEPEGKKTRKNQLRKNRDKIPAIMAFAAGLMGSPRIKLSRRFANTLLLLLAFRILVAIPVLHVDEERLNRLLAANPLIGLVDLFAGGETLNHFSIAAAGIFPYLVALILVQIAAATSSGVREMQRSEKGKKRLELLTRGVTISVAFLFAWSLSRYLSQEVGLFPQHIHWFTLGSFWPSLPVVSLVTVGSLISTVLSDVITRKGIGQGADVVLLGGSSLVFLKQTAHVVRSAPSGAAALERVGWILAAGMIIVIFSIYLMGAQRNIPINYAKRIVGRRGLPVPSSHLPSLLNYGRIRPVSAAIGVLALLQLSQNFFESRAHSWLGAAGLWLTGWINPNRGWYWLALGVLILVFTYMYNFSALWQTEPSFADELKRQGAFIPGVRPGQNTEQYIHRVVRSISLPGGVGVALLAAGVPYAILLLTHQNLSVTVLSLVVVVTTAQSLLSEVTAYHLAESYQGLLSARKKSLWDHITR
jgi:preprotein translocase subunit SecY